MKGRMATSGSLAPIAKEAHDKRIVSVLRAAAILGLAYVTYASLTWLPAAQIAAEAAERARTVEANKTFCEKYGVPPASPQHEACLADLMRIRLEESERLQRAIAMF